jgi:hypothetical protein
MRAANKTNIYLSKYAKLLLKESLQDIPDLSDICIDKNTGKQFKIPKNILVSNASYSGITPDIADRMHRLCVHNLWNPSEITKNGVESAYIYIVSRNPEIKTIKLNIPSYDPLRTPMQDIVHGVASGIEPYNISHFVQNLKGNGSRGNSSKGYITT